MDFISIETFMQYGAMGLLAGVLLYLLIRQQKKDDVRDNRLIAVVENNTIALTRVHEIMNRYQTTNEVKYGRR